jgi:hypothetical protein
MNLPRIFSACFMVITLILSGCMTSDGAHSSNPPTSNTTGGDGGGGGGGY